MTEAIVVLGGGLTTESDLSVLSQQRVDAAAQLFQANTTPIVLSGKWTLLSDTPFAHTEAAAMRVYARQLGVPDEALLNEVHSMDTAGNAYYVAEEYIEPRKWHDITVVTSDFHRERAEYLFRHILGARCAVTTVGTPSHLDRHALAQKAVVEASLLSFYRQLFADIAEGDLEGTYRALQRLPGYNESTPEFSRQALLAIVHTPAAELDIYGIRQHRGSH